MCCVYKIQCSPVEEPSEHRVVGIGMRAIYLVLTLRGYWVTRGQSLAHTQSIFMTSQVRKGELYRLVQNYFSFVRICAKKISHRYFLKFRPLDITNSRNLFPVKIRRVTSVLSTTNDAIAVISFPCFNVLNKFSSFKLLLR